MTRNAGSSSIGSIATGSVAVLLLLLIALTLASYILAGFVLHPRQPPGAPATEFPAAAFGISFEDAAFETEDGLMIRGWYVPASKPSQATVISVPGGRNNRADFLAYLPSWHAAGLDVLMIDPRGGGQSDDDGFGVTLGLRESRDVDAAVAWVQAQKPGGRIGVVGISQGGDGTVMSAIRNPAIDAVVMMSTGYDLAHLFRLVLPGLPSVVGRMSARMLLLRQGVPVSVAWALDYPQRKAASQLKQPVLFIHGTEDAVVSVASAETLFAAIPSNAKELWLVPGLEHEVIETEEAVRRVTLFFSGHLLAAIPEDVSGPRGSV